MYEYHLPSLVGSVTRSCGEAGLRLFADLLQDAATISRKIDCAHLTMRPIGDDGMANHDIYEALLGAQQKSLFRATGRICCGRRPLASYSPKIFVRLALYVLASNPAAAPDLARAYLIDPELIEATWCRD